MAAPATPGPAADHGPLAASGAETSADPATITDTYLRLAITRLALPANLQEAVLYALLAPGKRLRPTLALHAAAAVGGSRASALPAAAAVELVHAFSLVHDDLPAMDDDDLRRGRPTLHKQTSEAMAILAGDGMLTFAFGLLATDVKDPALANRLTAELARGATGMIAGQVYDTLRGYDGALSDADKLALIHRNKTGALIKAAARMGALSARCSERALEIIDDYADALGLMFQIVDDIIDATQPAEHVGKRTGKDQPAGKLTYPGALGLQAARDQVTRLEAQALSAAAKLGIPAHPLAQLARDMAVRTK